MDKKIGHPTFGGSQSTFAYQIWYVGEGIITMKRK